MMQAYAIVEVFITNIQEIYSKPWFNSTKVKLL